MDRYGVWVGRKTNLMFRLFIFGTESNKHNAHHFRSMLPLHFALASLLLLPVICSLPHETFTFLYVASTFTRYIASTITFGYGICTYIQCCFCFIQPAGDDVDECGQLFKRPTNDWKSCCRLYSPSVLDGHPFYNNKSLDSFQRTELVMTPIGNCSSCCFST